MIFAQQDGQFGLLDRWTEETFGLFFNNHTKLMDLLKWFLDNLNDREMKARIHGVQSQMRKFESSFSCLRVEKVLK